MDKMTKSMLPADVAQALLVGRVWRAGVGPSVVVVRGGEVFDITAHAPTMADLLDDPNLLGIARNAAGESLGQASALLDAFAKRRCR